MRHETQETEICIQSIRPDPVYWHRAQTIGTKVKSKGKILHLEKGVNEKCHQTEQQNMKQQIHHMCRHG